MSRMPFLLCGLDCRPHLFSLQSSPQTISLCRQTSTRMWSRKDSYSQGHGSTSSHNEKRGVRIHARGNLATNPSPNHQREERIQKQGTNHSFVVAGDLASHLFCLLLFQEQIWCILIVLIYFTLFIGIKWLEHTCWRWSKTEINSCKTFHYVILLST